jgi:hypothetical protein
MTIASTIKEGATSVAATGGTDVTLSSIGVVNGVNTFIFSTDTAAMTARTCEVSASLPTPNANSIGGYSQGRRSLVLKFPLVKASGERTVNTLRINGGFDVETTAAQIETYVEQAAQLLGSTAALTLWRDANIN